MPQRYEPTAWCPWITADRMKVRILTVTMTTGYYGASIWDPQTIYLARGIPPALTRCTLAREVLRLQRPALTDTTPVIVGRHERALTQATARLLIPITALAEAVRWALSRREQAEVLMVDERTLGVRLRCLTEDEWSVVTGFMGAVSA